MCKGRYKRDLQRQDVLFVSRTEERSKEEEGGNDELREEVGRSAWDSEFASGARHAREARELRPRRQLDQLRLGLDDRTRHWLWHWLCDHVLVHVGHEARALVGQQRTTGVRRDLRSTH